MITVVSDSYNLMSQQDFLIRLLWFVKFAIHLVPCTVWDVVGDENGLARSSIYWDLLPT